MTDSARNENVADPKKLKILPHYLFSVSPSALFWNKKIDGWPLLLFTEKSLRWKAGKRKEKKRKEQNKTEKKRKGKKKKKKKERERFFEGAAGARGV